jgi:hypothetical protein
MSKTPTSKKEKHLKRREIKEKRTSVVKFERLSIIIPPQMIA